MAGPLRLARRHPIVAAVTAIAGIAWLVGSIGVRVARITPNARRDLGPTAEPVRFETDDGVRIAATFWPGRDARAPGVLIVPGLGSLHRKLAPNAIWLAAQGYAVLAIDLRGHGRSGPALHSFGWRESHDVHAAFAWLKRRQSGAKVAVIGISMGAAASLVGPAGPVQADAMILQAVFADLRSAVRARVAWILGGWLGRLFEPLLSFQSLPRFGIWPSRITPLAVVPKVACPVLVIGGGSDEFIPTSETLAIHRAVRDARGLWIAAGLDHCGVSDTLSDDYRWHVLRFLDETIGGERAVSR